jgi:hypothetical protein
MGILGNTCRMRATECTLAAKAAAWRGDQSVKAMYLMLAQQWLDIATIGDAADQERELERELEEAELMLDQARNAYVDSQMFSKRAASLTAS